MKQLLFLFLFSTAMGTMQAQKLSSAQTTQVNTLISTANKSIIQANTTQDAIIKRLLTDSATKTRLLTDLAAATKRLQADSATKTKLISDQAALIKRLFADSAAKAELINSTRIWVGQINGRMYTTEGINRSDSILIASLQLQIDATSDAVVKAYLEASRKDSIAGVPGQIDVTPFKGGFTWSLSPDLLLRILKLEAKLPTK